MTLKEQLEKEFDEKFPYIPHNDNFGSDGSVTGGSDIKQEVHAFLSQSIDRVLTEVENKCRKMIINGDPHGNAAIQDVLQIIKEVRG